ncbi:hypothetical protein BGZ76_006348 [Entomortierella beljakovae]|nr:hypothetical protein BGZ76_006348 [Entomortierella beljakovae]
MNLHYYDFLIGMDLFSRFGFSIGGIRIPVATDEDDIPTVDDLKPSIVLSEASKEESTEEFKEQKKLFLQSIEPGLRDNTAIDPKSHCDLEIMRVVLDVKDDCVIREPSRRFYVQAEVQEVNKTVKTWLDNGVIITSLCP